MATYSWTITDLPNNKASLAFTPPVSGSPVYNFNNIQIGDNFVVLGPEFSAANRGCFTVETVDIANKTVTYTNSTASTETVNLATEAASLDKVSFWHAPLKTVYDAFNPAYVTTEPNIINGIPCQKSKVSLPVNTDIVTRNSSNAAYLSEPETATTSAITRLPDGTTTFTAPGYTKTSGHVEILGFLPRLPLASDYIITPGTPATSGSLTGTTDSSQFTHAFTDTYYKGCGATTLTDLKNHIIVIGGRNIDTSTDIHSVSVYAPGAVTVGANQEVSYAYAWSKLNSANISGVGSSAVVLDCQRFWNSILIVGGYPLGPGHATGAGFTQTKSFLYSVDTNILTEITGTTPDPHPADCALVWTGEFALAIGGKLTDGSISSYVALWDPSYSTSNQLGKWYKSDEGYLLEERTDCKAVTLDSGKVLVIGGRRTIVDNSFDLFNVGTPINTCELITPETDFSTAVAKTGQMSYSRFAFGMTKLPDGRVLVVGGIGGKPCQPITTTDSQELHELTSCEIYDPTLGYWSPLPDTLEAHSYCNCNYDSVHNRVYVFGGAFSTKIEYLDLETMTWHFSIAELSASSFRTSGSVCNINTNYPIVVRAGGSYFNNLGQEKNTDQTFTTVLYNETVRNSGINGIHKLTASNTFKTNSGWTKGTTSSVTTVTAQASDVKGPYIYDKNQIFGIKGVTLTSQTTIPEGRGCPLLTITEDITNINQTGYFVANFGRKDQVGPVSYTRISVYKLQPDPHFKFPSELNNNNLKLSLVDKGSYIPPINEQKGAFYLTASNAGLEAARQYVTDISAGGIDLEIEVRYPGDRGLGDEGKPVKGSHKLSDVVEVFGPNDLDSFLEKVRNE